MSHSAGGPHWKIWLPVAAVMAASLMLVLAFTVQRTMIERNELALEGRLFGLAHSAEERLREVGLSGAELILGELLANPDSEVAGLVLQDRSEQVIAEIGQVSPALQVRSIDLFLGRMMSSQEQPYRGGLNQPGPGAPGRGRFDLHLYLAHDAGSLPLVARLIVPATALVSIALVWLAMLSGRFLERERNVIQETAERHRLEALARAGAGLAHQLRTPLATIKGTSQLMAEQCGNSALLPRIEIVVGQTERMNRLLGRLLDYARPPEPEPRLLDIPDVIAGVADRHEGLVAKNLTAITGFVDREHLVEILDNLITNAVVFSPEEDSVVIELRQDGGETLVTISDRGPGPGDDPEHLFEPYQTSRADGTGLGLPIARTLAEANHGSLTLAARPEGGCVAVLRLPSTEAMS